MFEDNGRVKVIKLRGELSEGFIIPLTIFQNYIISITNKELNNIKEGIEFDTVEHEGKEFWISKKYVAKRQYSQSTGKSSNKTQYKVSRQLDRVRDDQFRFHYTTTIIKKCPYVINPESLIQISHKIHGTSGISAYVLCHKPLS